MHAIIQIVARAPQIETGQAEPAESLGEIELVCDNHGAFCDALYDLRQAKRSHR